jgi:UDP-N-acetylglucosamine--N-acetylmuramyl-(pentapeptide) pyrophosphoryl-undecaprenol N-acetylglucosamine transferase
MKMLDIKWFRTKFKKAFVHKEKKIILTGGGSAGHVTPNLALIEKLRAKNWQIFYLGGKKGIEKNLIPKEIPFYGISSGKLRRYFSLKNFVDPFLILVGITQAFFICRKIKPDVIFSKGGFVAFPVVFAGWLNRIPVIIHESDLTVGLANRLSRPFAKKVCLAFPRENIAANEVFTGNPIRKELLHGDAKKGRLICGFVKDKPVILVWGGSLGAEKVNQVVRKALPQLLEKFQIAHICGEGKEDKDYCDAGYCQFGYLKEEFADLLALADLVIARSGANSVYEIIALKKPHIFIPLSKKQSRGDQIFNARYFERLGMSYVLDEEDLNQESLLTSVDVVFKNQDQYLKRMREYQLKDGVDEILKIILSVPGSGY